MREDSKLRLPTVESFCVSVAPATSVFILTQLDRNRIYFKPTAAPVPRLQCLGSLNEEPKLLHAQQRRGSEAKGKVVVAIRGEVEFEILGKKEAGDFQLWQRRAGSSGWVVLR